MKVAEWMHGNRMLEQMNVDMQLRFTHGISIKDAIFTVRKVQQRHRGKDRASLYNPFGDVRKTLGRTAREAVMWL